VRTEDMSMIYWKVIW